MCSWTNYPLPYFQPTAEYICGDRQKKHLSQTALFLLLDMEEQLFDGRYILENTRRSGFPIGYN